VFGVTRFYGTLFALKVFTLDEAEEQKAEVGDEEKISLNLKARPPPTPSPFSPE
jgi:hypothetical protein